MESSFSEWWARSGIMRCNADWWEWNDEVWALVTLLYGVDTVNRGVAWFVNGVFSFVLLFAGLGIGLRITTWLIGRAVERRKYLMRSWNPAESDELRTESITRVLQTAARAIFGVLAVVVVLGSFGVDLGAILASVSLVSIALGFGAQYLVRDYLSGILILAEDQYRVGDSVEINKIAGTVDDMRLRLTVLRDAGGTLHQIPNGEIRVVANRSRESTAFDSTITVSYGADLREAVQVVDRTGQEMASDPNWKALVRHPIHAADVQNLSEEGIVIRLAGDAVPNQSQAVFDEFRRRLDAALAEAGIEASWQ